MRRGALSVCVVALFAFLAAPGAAPSTLAGSSGALTARDNSLIAAVNAERALELLPKLRLDYRLARAARAHSLDMLRHDYFGHGNFSGRMSLFHVRGSMFAENLAWGTGVMSAGSVLAHWVSSPAHRAILLDPHLHRIGVATPIGAFGGFSRTTMVTADFAG
jgi:uncharacterized protein YkwD